MRSNWMYNWFSNPSRCSFIYKIILNEYNSSRQTVRTFLYLYFARYYVFKPEIHFRTVCVWMQKIRRSKKLKEKIDLPNWEKQYNLPPLNRFFLVNEYQEIGKCHRTILLILFITKLSCCYVNFYIDFQVLFILL